MAIPNITLRPISGADVAAFKSVRLAALQDTPFAFGSTYERESRFTDADWVERVRQWNGDHSVCYLAWDDASPCGIVAGLLDPPPEPGVHLVSMWVAPAYRRLGVGRQLAHAVLHWATVRRADSVYLSVTSANQAATRFYERLGFTKTGKTAPYPNDPAMVEYEMIRPVSSLLE